MKRNRSNFVGVLGIMSIFLMLFHYGELTAAEYNFKAGHTYDPNHPTGKSLVHFADEVAKESKGRIKITVFPSGGIGSMNEMYDQQKIGALEMSAMYFVTVGRNEPKLLFDDLAYLWPSLDVAMKAYKGDLGKICDNLFYQQGIKMLNYTLPLGFRNITNNVRPINRPEDGKGLKIRIFESKIRLDAFQAMGMSPTPMPFGELYTAMQMKTVDGQENPLSMIYVQRFYEVQKYLSLTRHLFTNGGIGFSRPIWEKLPKDIQGILQKCATDAEKYDLAVLNEQESTALDQLKAKGMIVNEVKDIEPFRTAIKPVYKKWGPTFGPEIITALKKYTGAEF
jgi:tripartite ATP-independent transporter DctP family solute receptor